MEQKAGSVLTSYLKGTFGSKNADERDFNLAPLEVLRTGSASCIPPAGFTLQGVPERCFVGLRQVLHGAWERGIEGRQ